MWLVLASDGMERGTYLLPVQDQEKSFKEVKGALFSGCSKQWLTLWITFILITSRTIINKKAARFDDEQNQHLQLQIPEVSGVRLRIDDFFYTNETGSYPSYSVFMKFKDGTVNPNFETALDSLMDIFVTCRKGDASTKDEKHKKRAFFDFVRDNGHRKMQTEVQHKKLRR